MTAYLHLFVIRLLYRYTTVV